MTPTLSLLTLAGILALSGATILLWVVCNAFVDSKREGVRSLLVPGYVLYYGWTRFSHPRRKLLVASALAALLAAALGGVVTALRASPAELARVSGLSPHSS